MRSISLAPALAIAAIAVGGCGGNDYPAKVEKQLLAGCKSNGDSKSKCECQLDALKGKLSYSEYKKVKANKVDSDLTKKVKAFTKEAKKC
jgi:hypothetical protein